MSTDGRNVRGLYAFERLRDRARQCREYAELYLRGAAFPAKLAAMSPEEVTLTFAEIDAADEILGSAIETYNRLNNADIRFVSYEDYKAKYGNPTQSVWDSISESSRLVAMWCEFAITQLAGLQENKPAIHHHTYRGPIYMGDVFQGISNSTIVSRSVVESAFNQLQNSGNHEGGALLVDIAKLVSDANNAAASAVYAQMAQELAKPAHDKGLLKSFWNGLVAILPSLATLSAAVIKAFGLPV